MNRIDRLQAILTTLQSKRVVTAESLADKFEVSIRTIYRDIRALEEGGIPIGAEAGIGYYIMEGYHLPPVMFTHEEARVLLMAGKVLEKMSDNKTARIFGDALTKIQAVLDSAKKEELEDLENKIKVLPLNFQPLSPSEEVLDKIKEALARCVNVTFDYFANNNGLMSSRSVDPLGICYYGHHWHLIGYCHLRNDYRDFRVDRVSNFSLTNTRFKPSKYLSLQEYLDSLVSSTELIKAVIRVDASIAKFIVNTKYHMGFMQEHRHQDYTEMEFATFSLNYFARWLLMMGNNVKIVEPKSLEEEMTRLVKDLQETYLI